jgi:hypothetical protein
MRTTRPHRRRLALLNHNGFAIADIGGKGRFTPLDARENFYTESEPNSIGLLDTGTMGYRLPFLRVGREKNKLNHPVKPLCSAMREAIGRQCHRCLPSSLVQMLKKCGIRPQFGCERLPKSKGSRFYRCFIGGKLSPYFQSNHGSSKPRDNRGTKVRGCADNRQNQPRKTRSAQSGIAI